MIKHIKERIIGITGSASGITSILGSWQVCHNICLGVITLLGILGITVVGMPLIFLTKLTVPFWSAAVIILLVVVGLYIKKKCISKNLIIFNSGLIIAGIPFKMLEGFRKLFWIIGGSLVLAAIVFFIHKEISNRKFLVCSKMPRAKTRAFLTKNKIKKIKRMEVKK